MNRDNRGSAKGIEEAQDAVALVETPLRSTIEPLIGRYGHKRRVKTICIAEKEKDHKIKRSS